MPLNRRPLFRAPAEGYAEQLEFDERTGTFVPSRQPEPGTPDGDLEIARREVIRGNHSAGRKLLEAWERQYAGSGREDEAKFYIAESYLLEGRYSKAHEEFEEFLANFAGSSLYTEAVQRELVIAQSFLAGKRRIWLRFIPIPAYGEGLEIAAKVEGYASGTTLEEQAIKLQADYHFAAGDMKLAEDAYARLARRFPRGRFHRAALLQSAQSALATFTGTKFDITPLARAESRFRELEQQYPEVYRRLKIDAIIQRMNLQRAEHRFQVAQYYEKTGATSAAVFYYRLVASRHPDTFYAEPARAKLAALVPVPAVVPPPAPPRPAGPEISPTEVLPPGVLAPNPPPETQPADTQPAE